VSCGQAGNSEEPAPLVLGAIYNLTGTQAALGYDAARLVMTALAQAEGPDPEGVRKALAKIRRFEGVTGTLSYPAGSRIPSKSVTKLHVERGQRKLVRQVLPARVPPP